MAAAKAILDDDVLEDKISGALKKRDGKATTADVVVDTGIPTIEVERMLRRMISHYRCHLDVTEDGELLYQFDPRMRPNIDESRSRIWLRKAGRLFWKGFVVFMKALIWIVMVAYVVIFVALIVAAMVAAASRSGSSSRRSSSWGGSSSSSSRSGGNFWFWYWVFGRRGDPYRSRSYHNPAYGRYGKRKQQKKDPRPFYMKVFSFVLGPELGEIDPLDDDPALLGYIRQQGGAVTTMEIVGRTGWTSERAEARLTRMMAHYDGNVIVTDDAELVFTFADLLPTMGRGESGKALPAFWERWERPMQVTGNQGGANAIICLMNLFNLGMAFIAPALALEALGWGPSGALMFGLSYFPLGFAGLIFGIPILRWLFMVIPENRRRGERNVRRAIYQQVFRAAKSGTPVIRAEALAQQAKSRIPEWAENSDVSVSTIEKRFEKLVPQLGGDVDLEGGGDRYTFAALAANLSGAQQTRRQLTSGQGDRLKLAFSTREEAQID